MKKEVTLALLKNEYIEAFIRSVTINTDVDSITEIQLTLLVADNTQLELVNLINGKMGKIAIIKI
jgi:hypothetical protein